MGTLPVVKAAEDAEVKAVDAEEKKTVVPLHYGYGYGYPFHHYYGKREAEAEPAADAEAKADPWLAYSGYAGYPYAHHLPYYTHPVVTKKVVKAADGEEKAVVPLTLPYGGLYNYGYGYLSLFSLLFSSLLFSSLLFSSLLFSSLLVFLV